MAAFSGFSIGSIIICSYFIFLSKPFFLFSHLKHNEPLASYMFLRLK